jgi:hypothetical protein
VKASELVPHPQNWRLHPEHQREAMAGMLSEIGYASGLIARELPNGKLQILDGHLRRDLTPDSIVPVQVVDLSEKEAEILLAGDDALTLAAEVDVKKLRKLVHGLKLKSIPLAECIQGVACIKTEPINIDFTKLAADDFEDKPEPPPDVTIERTYSLVVTCADEQDQKDLWERMQQEGRTCRVLTL